MVKAKVESDRNEQKILHWAIKILKDYRNLYHTKMRPFSLGTTT